MQYIPKYRSRTYQIALLENVGFTDAKKGMEIIIHRTGKHKDERIHAVFCSFDQINIHRDSRSHKVMHGIGPNRRVFELIKRMKEIESKLP